MWYIESPYLCRLFNVLLIGGLLLFLSCQSDIPVFNPSDGYKYQFHSFPLDFNNSKSLQKIEQNFGNSSRLYTGIINGNDTVYTLLRLLPVGIQNHDVCSADSKDSISISLSTLEPIATQDGDSFSPLIDEDFLNIYSVSLNQQWTEESNIDPSIVDMILTQATESTDLDVSYRENDLIIEFPMDGTTISQWCEKNNTDDFGLLISYLPVAENTLPYIEFFSSENIESKQPKLNFSYKTNGDTTFVERRYTLDGVSTGSAPGNLVKPYIIDNILSTYWGMVYAYNLPEDEPELPLVYTSIQHTLDDIILENQIDTELALFQINITRNSNYTMDIDSITFWLDNAVAYKSTLDPAGDNDSELADSTEGNLVFDWEDLNGDGLINSYFDQGVLYHEAENFYDFGTDGCLDSLESGIDNGCVPLESSHLSPYNPDGTEGNGQFDWVDNDNNGIWSDEDSGEQWWDWGDDWCPDSLETGEGNSCDDGPPCNCSSATSSSTSGYDLNGDNVDPIGDDWSLDNEDGTEGNGLWDVGEPLYDWGTDGVPSSFAAGETDNDLSEGNNIWNEGEQFWDTGSDGKFNKDEVDNYQNRTEGNSIFDAGEKYLDCGQDGLCDDDDPDDDYNIDPNGDNCESCTQKNDLWENGEDFDDWGFDHIHDSQEAFMYFQKLIPDNQDLILSPNNNSRFQINVEEDQPYLFPQPNLGSGKAIIWISEIEKNQNEYSWKIIVSVYTTVPLTGLQLKLNHTPLVWNDTIPLSYESSVSQIRGNKLYQDITISPKATIPNDSLNNNLMINYSNSLLTMLDFNGLKDTLEKWEELFFSHEYSNLVLYIDTTINLRENINIIMKNEAVDNSEIINNDNIIISSDMDSIVIPMGTVMQHFEYGSLGNYRGIYLESEGTSYNYSYIQFYFDQNNDEKNPRLDLTYRR